MVMIFKNVLNDVFARDTSNKIKAVKQSTFKTGKYIGCYVPFGYQKARTTTTISSWINKPRPLLSEFST
jgi:hypothetical protein